MPLYTIYVRGQIFGSYEGKNDQEALAKLAKEQGCESNAAFVKKLGLQQGELNVQAVLSDL